MAPPKIANNDDNDKDSSKVIQRKQANGSNVNISPATDISEDGDKLTLKREYGLPSATALVIGSIVGSGIFISPQGALRNSGSVGLCLIVWLGGALFSLIAALTYMELVSVVRKSGGDYSVLLKTMGPIPAFLALWTGEIMIAAGRGIQALSFSEYCLQPFMTCGVPELTKKLVSCALIIALTVTNSYSVRLSARIQVFFTVAKLLALAIIIVGGVYTASIGTYGDIATGFEGSVTSPAKISKAFYSVMFAYSGWNYVNAIIEELKRPRRTAPMASILGIAIVSIIYILVNVSYMLVLSKKEMYSSNAVAMEWASRVLGPVAWIIPLAVVMSVYGSANGAISATTRTMFVAARDGLWFQFLSYVHVTKYTPIPAIVFQFFPCIFMIWIGSISSLINFVSFLGLIIQTLASLCVIILRFKVKDDPHRIKVPIVIPILFTLFSVFLVIAPLVEDPSIDMLYGLAVIGSGLVVYFPLFYYKLKPKCMDKLEIYLQLFMQVAPGGYDETYD